MNNWDILFQLKIGTEADKTQAEDAEKKKSMNHVEETPQANGDDSLEPVEEERNLSVRRVQGQSQQPVEEERNLSVRRVQGQSQQPEKPDQNLSVKRAPHCATCTCGN